MFRLLVLALLCGSAAAAQPLPDLVTDRPDFTESAVVVPLGYVQAEAGVSFIDNGPIDSFSGPELLVRWTPLSRVELRFGAPDYIATDDADGFGDPSLGTKVQFGPFAQWDLAVIATASLPVGDDAFSSGTIDPDVIVTTALAASDYLAYGGQVGVGRDGAADLWLFDATLVQSASFPEDAPLFFNERWGAFIELALTVPERGGAALLQHMGGTYALSPNTQLDFHFGTGLTNAAPTSLFGVGLTVRK
ncbi:MAG: transporter [Rhodothermales bacterium]